MYCAGLVLQAGVATLIFPLPRLCDLSDLSISFCGCQNIRARPLPSEAALERLRFWQRSDKTRLAGNSGHSSRQALSSALFPPNSLCAQHVPPMNTYCMVAFRARLILPAFACCPVRGGLAPVLERVAIPTISVVAWKRDSYQDG